MLKFRAWDKEQKVMLTWEQIMDYRYNERWFVDNVDKNYINCIFTDPDLILMLGMGIKDRNGTDIYESDIMTHPDFVEGTELAIEFVDGCFYMGGWDCTRTDFTKGPVIGNIYEDIKS